MKDIIINKAKSKAGEAWVKDHFVVVVIKGKETK